MDGAPTPVDPLDPVTFAAELIRAPSVTPQDAGAIPRLRARLEQMGFRCEEVAFAEPGTEPVLNLYARLGTEGRNFCFAGHTDVVPPGNPDAWSVDPFAGEIRGAELWGRGAADMKGAIACFVAATQRFLAAHGREFGGSISLLITGDEEGVSINGTKKLVEWAVRRGERLDACVVGEPTSARALGDMMKIGRRGSLNAFLDVEGVQGHTAYPHLADNAAHRLVGMLHALTAASLDDGTPHFPPSSLQISTVDVGNRATNIIPDRARAVFNVRFNDRWTSKTVEEFIRAKLDAAGGRYRLELQVSGEAFLVPPGEISGILAQAIRGVTGREPELSTTGGTSDARFIHRHCPVAEFGLVGLTMHKADERVPLADLALLTEIYRKVLELYFPAAKA